MRLNLRGKIVIPTLFIFFVSTALTFWYTYSATEQELRSVVMSRLQGELRTVVVGLSGAEEAILRDLEGVSVIPPVNALMNAGKPAGELRPLLEELSFSLNTKPLVANNVFKYITIIDKNGNSLISSNAGPMPLSGYDTKEASYNGKSLDSESEQQMLSALLRGETVFGAAMELEKEKAYIPVGVPIFRQNSKEVLGAIIGCINFETLAKRYVLPIRIGKDGHAFVAGDRGVIFSHPNDGEVMVEPKKHFLTPKLVDMGTGTHSYSYGGKDWIAVFDTLAAPRWTSIVKVNAAEVFEPIRHIGIVTMTASAIALGLVAVFLFILIHFVVISLKKAIVFAESVADGDLAHTITVKTGDEVETLGNALNSMVRSFREMIAHGDAQTNEAKAQTEIAQKAVQEAEKSRREADKARVEGIHHAATQLESLTDVLIRHISSLDKRIQMAAEGCLKQRRQSDANISSLSDMNEAIAKVGYSAESASQSAEKAQGLAETGAGAVNNVAASIQDVNSQALQLKESLHSLGIRAEGIGQIMAVISDIADQTNLLALNAAIEAARAGEAGRGFAVVADEVRKLAEKTMTATREVGDSVTAIQSATNTNISLMDETSITVNNTTKLAEQAGGSLIEIVGAVKTNAGQVAEIATASSAQAQAGSKITQGVQAVDDVSIATAQLMDDAKKELAAVTTTTGNLQALLKELKN